MKLRTLRNLSRRKLRGQRVLLRLDLNAPIVKGKLESADLWKLKSSVLTIEYLRHHGARVIIVSHLGRPNGKKDPKTSLKPILKKFGQMIGQKIELWTQHPEKLAARSLKLEDGQIVALENIRWHKGEESCSATFSKQLAKLADIYVDDAFGVIQRPHASNYGVTKYLPSYAGFLLEYEVQQLYNLIPRSERPIVAIMGGSKISTKMGLIKQLLRRVDYVLFGGALANNLLQAKDMSVGKSLVDNDAKVLRQYLVSNKIRLPLDARVATSLEGKSKIVPISKVGSLEHIYDIGPDTVALYSSIIKQAKTVIWNGPLGLFEEARFGLSTRELIQTLAHSKTKAYVGGGETVKAVLQSRLEDKIHFVSTGGGAMLSLLEDSDMPALQALYKK
jgi:phosphoglycerate kinase